MGLLDIFKKKETLNISLNKNEISAPVDGTIKDLASLNDGMFSEKILGDGFVIKPSNGTFIVPVDAEMKVVFKTGHAYGLEMSDGTELLIHIGIDTVNMNGKGFKSFVKVGDKVKAGDPLCSVDLKEIAKAGYVDDAIIISTNGKEIKTLLNEGETVTKGTVVAKVNN